MKKKKNRRISIYILFHLKKKNLFWIKKLKNEFEIIGLLGIIENIFVIKLYLL